MEQDIGNYIESALDVGNFWLMSLEPNDPRRTGVVAMSVLLVDWRRRDPSTADIDDLHSMVCSNCRELHPALAVLCGGKPIESCWLLKGYRCPVVQPAAATGLAQPALA